MLYIGFERMRQIKINGESQRVHAATVSELIREIELPVRLIAVELNLEVVPKSQYDGTLLKDDDCIEIVHMIGGG